MLVAPKNVPRFRVNHRQICISCRRLLVVIGNGVFGYVTVVHAACLATSEDDVASFVRVGGKKNIRSACFGSSTSWNFPHFRSWATASFPTASEPV